MAHIFIPTYVGNVSDVVRCFPLLFTTVTKVPRLACALVLLEAEKKWCVFHLNMDMRGCCHLSQWLLLNSFSRDKRTKLGSLVITAMLQVICSYVFSSAFRNKDLSFSLSLALMFMSGISISKQLLIHSSCIWHVCKTIKKVTVQFYGCGTCVMQMSGRSYRGSTQVTTHLICIPAPYVFLKSAPEAFSKITADHSGKTNQLSGLTPTT